MKKISAPRALSLSHGLILLALTLLTALPGLSRVQVIDRDEARYAQATVQMIDSGDAVDIRFQDAPRWKKPAGAYWAQALSVMALGGPQERAIWKHRLPSVLAALIVVFATYFAGIRLIGREGAFIGASLMAVSLALSFEAHSAKTDALLLAAITLCFAALSRLRHGGAKGSALLFWAALGVAVMIKGPIAPAIVGLCILSLLIWERRAAWLRPLAFFPGPLAFVVIVAPWMYLIYMKTGGAFFSVAISQDLAPKLAGGHESHGGPPGYHLIALLLMFVPGLLLRPAGLAFAARVLRVARKDKSSHDAKVPRAVRFLLCWALPFWIVLELMPTKLPHYTLPLYPALALLSGAAGATLLRAREFPVTFRLGGVLLAIGSTLIIGAGLYAHSLYSKSADLDLIALGLGAVILLGLLMASLFALFMKARAAILSAIVFGAALYAFAFGYLLPGLYQFQVSPRIATVLKSRGFTLPLSQSQRVISAHFTEPSLVYHLGTSIELGGDALARISAAPAGTLALIDMRAKDSADFLDPAKAGCFEDLGKVSGFNYAAGDAVEIALLRKTLCAAPASEEVREGPSEP